MRAVLLLYTVSGFAGLAWQVLWVRAWVPVFGSGLAAVSCVTAVFLGSLGLGGLLAGPILHRRPALRVYAGMEAFVGLWGMAIPWALLTLAPIMTTVLSWTGEGVAGMGVRLLSAGLLIAPPALALGVTLPAIATALRADERPSRVGLAYGLNALGAAAGALVAGLWLPWVLGVSKSSLLLGTLNLIVAAVACWLPNNDPPASEPRSVGIHSRMLVTIAFLSGACGLALEVTWSRLCGPLLVARGGDAAAFAGVLAAVLVGIGFGGVIGGHSGKRAGRVLWGLQAALAVSTLLVLEPARAWILGPLPREVIEGMLPIVPALFLGATFPLLSNELLDQGGDVRRGLGRLAAINTFGAVVGSLLAGFVLVPLFGAQRLAVVLAGLASGIAFLGLLRDRHWGRWPWAVVSVSIIGWAIVRTPPVAGQRLLPEDETLLVAVEGRQGSSLVVSRPDGERVLISGGHRITEAGRGRVNDHALRAMGPASLHGAPRRVLAIGLGTGETARAFLDVDTVEELVVVEIDANQPGLLSWFGTEQILEDPRLRLVTGDGRHFLRINTEEWDVISVDAYGPRTAAAIFYTQEFFAEAAARLAPGGLVFVKFNPASLPDTETVAAFMGAAFDPFADAALVYLNNGFAGLVGGRDRLTLPRGKVLADKASAAPILEGVRRVSDDHPVTVPNLVVRDPHRLDPFRQNPPQR